MAENTTTPNPKAEIHKKIVAMQNAVKVGKDGKNDFKDFSYFEPEVLNREINKLSDEHKVIFIFTMPFNKDKDMYEGLMKIQDLETDQFQDYQMDMPLTEVAAASKGQNAGATMTYCKRYLIQDALNIADNRDDLDATPSTGSRRGRPVGAKSAEKPSGKFEEMMAKLDRVKKDQLPVFLQKVKESTQYTDDQKAAFAKRVEELQK